MNGLRGQEIDDDFISRYGAFAGIVKEPFGKTPDGLNANLYTLKNKNGMAARISDYGGILVSLFAPDRNGRMEDVVLGFDSMEGYWNNTPYFGALIGRYANRIANASFILNGKEYKLNANHGKHHLHGGNKGFDKVLWDATAYMADEGESLSLKYQSKDGEEGYPGTLDVEAIYTLTEANELRIEYKAVSDKDTVVNLTNHSYFNLAGVDGAEINEHLLQVTSDNFVAVDSELIPSGGLRSVTDTPMDMREPAQIGPRLVSGNEQIKFGCGFDHSWEIRGTPGVMNQAVLLHDPISGRTMKVETTMTGVQIFTPWFPLYPMTGKNGVYYNGRNGLCFETGFFPNAVNIPAFPSPTLPAGQLYTHTTIFSFSAEG